MLKHNIYFLYPAGFGGSYLRWAISISDKDLAKTAPLDPLNTSSSTQLGGLGTSHGHTRIPTHQLFMQHLLWYLEHKPQDKKIYLINVDGHKETKRGPPEFAITSILKYDPTAIIVNIHDGNDPLIASFGNINSVTKWPTFMHLMLLTSGIKNIDAFNCDTIQFRNLMVEDKTLLHRGRQISFEYVKANLSMEQLWFNERSKFQPHEVNEIQYPYLTKLKNIDLNRQVFELTCKDAMSFEALNVVSKVLSLASDNFDLSYVNGFHQNYINAQDNLKWFNSVKIWQKTGILDEYLMSHAIIEAQVIDAIDRSYQISRIENWENMSLQEVNDEYQSRRSS